MLFVCFCFSLEYFPWIEGIVLFFLLTGNYAIPCPIILTFDILGSDFGDGNPQLMSDCSSSSSSHPLKKSHLLLYSSGPLSLFLEALNS